nr:dynein assembly factor 3, axonemal homolog [Onthophagus taurus]
MLWGLTPALDLAGELNRHVHLNDEVNILLVGSSDCRHILKTLAKRYTRKHIKLNFFIMESCQEAVAKQILLLYLALRPEEELGIVQKTRYFMELYGNSMIRPAVANYLSSRSSDFVEMITNYEYMNEIMPFLKLDIKYKDRDYIENVFKFWGGIDPFDICDCWDKRVRKTLGVRYDNKKGAFDWDLQMRFHAIGGNIVGGQEYQYFRSTGVAFSWLESEVSKPNRSMVTGVIPNGEKFLHYGYLGDIITGPFVTYGLECSDPTFLTKTNNLYANRSTDVTERNLREIFHEIHYNSNYTHQKTSDVNLGYCVAQLNDLKVTDVQQEKNVIKKKVRKCIEIEDFTVTFLSLQMLSSMKHKEKFHNLFDVVYFNSSYIKNIEQDLIEKIANNQSLLYIENCLFVLNCREKDLEEYKKNVLDKIGELDKKEIEFNPTMSKYFKFIIK